MIGRGLPMAGVWGIRHGRAMTALRTEWQAGSDVGAVRRLNEDSWHADGQAGLWAVADGMGGLSAGDRASRTIAGALAGVGRRGDLETLLDDATRAIHAANGAIHSESLVAGARMGSTVVALAIVDRRFGVLWAGDSRAYLLRGRQLHRLTRDHSQVQEMVDRGLLAPEAAAGHPLGHVLSRAIGVEPSVEIASVIDTAADGDVFLLCSDGLHGLLSDDEIAGVLERANGDAPATLIRHCLARGAPDNVTIVTIALDETTALIFQPADTVQ